MVQRKTPNECSYLKVPDKCQMLLMRLNASWCCDPRGLTMIVRQGTKILSDRMSSSSNLGRPETLSRESESQRFEADRNLSCFRSEVLFGKQRLEVTFGPPAF